MSIRQRLQSAPLRLLCLLWLTLAGLPVAAGRGAVFQEPFEVSVRGQVLLPDGAPAEGVTVILVTRMPKPDGEGKKTSWSGSVETGADGAFTIAYEGRRGMECLMTANLVKHQPLKWSWDEHPANGVLVLPPEQYPQLCYVTGSVVGADGVLLIEGWQIWARSDHQVLFADPLTNARFFPDPETGEFRIGPLLPGEFRISAAHQAWGTTREVTVPVHAGEPAQVVLRYDGSNPYRSIRVKMGPSLNAELLCGLDFFAGPFQTADVDPRRSYLLLVNPDGSIQGEAERTGVLGNRLAFLDVSRGEYAIELRHPCFESVRIEKVMPGDAPTLRLKGSAQILLGVLDGSGEPVRSYDLEIRYKGQGGRTGIREEAIRLRSDQKIQLLDFVVPGKITLALESAAGGRGVVELGVVEPGETRQVVAELSDQLPMDVLVLDAEGQPVEGLEVQATLGGIDELDAATRRVGPITAKVIVAGAAPEVEKVLKTDAEGRVTVDDAAPGPWTLVVFASRYTKVVRTFDYPLPDGGPVVLHLPATGRLEGQLLGPDGFDWSSITMNAAIEESGPRFLHPSRPDVRPRVDTNGGFVLSGIPVGDLRLHFWVEDQRSGFGGARRKLPGETVEILGGPQRWSLDIAPFLTATCEAAVILDGEQRSGLRVVLVPVDRMDRYAQRSRVRDLRGYEAVTDGGRAVVAGLQAGAPYRALVAGEEGVWLAAVGTVDGQTYSSPSRAEWSLDLVEREVLVRGIGGSGLANTKFGWACQRMTTAGARATTDDDSRMTLRMPSGTYSLFRADLRRPELVPFEWAPGDGPLVIEVPEKK